MNDTSAPPRCPAAAIDTSDPLKLLGQILSMAVRHKASDIHLRTRNHPILRVDGSCARCGKSRHCRRNSWNGWRAP